MITILIITTFLFFSATIVLGMGCYNLLKQVEQLEEITMNYHVKFVEIRQLALDNQVILNDLDLRGAFKSEDEVGTVFENIKKISDDLSKNILDIYGTRE